MKDTLHIKDGDTLTIFMEDSQAHEWITPNQKFIFHTDEVIICTPSAYKRTEKRWWQFWR